MLTVQVPVPEQPPPLQPPKVDGEVGIAVRVTEVLYAKAYEQVAPQLMPTGRLVTVPLPAPALPTVNVWLLGLTVTSIYIFGPKFVPLWLTIH